MANVQRVATSETRASDASAHTKDFGASDQMAAEAGAPIAVQPRQDCFTLIHFLRALVRERIESSMSWDTLKSPELELTLLRPLVDKIAKTKHPAVLVGLLICRLRFQAEAELQLAFSGIFTTRAMLCELLCIRLLSIFASDQQELINVLTTSFEPMSGAQIDMFVEHDRPSAQEMKKLKEWSATEAQNALEMAIKADARHFIAAPLTQRVLESIYAGELTMDSPGGHSLLADDWKRRPVQAYDVRTRPLLDHYLLRVPKVRAVLEFATFAVLVMLYCLVMKYRKLDSVDGWEVAFIVFTAGFALDELAQFTNGLYFSDLWNALDISFIVLFLCFLALRLGGLVAHSHATADFAFDLLSTGSIILFPRAAGALIRDSVVILGIQALFKDFLYFMLIAGLCASGFVFTLTYMAAGRRSTAYIAYLLLRVWFGNNYIGFAEANDYSPYFGPAVLIIFAAFANTLLLTILIAILSADFAAVQATATEAFLFQRAIKTLERVKSESLHEYIAPTNLIAFAILLPASRIVSPRYLHKINVTLSRCFNAPLLLTISLYMRWRQDRVGTLHLEDDSWTSLLSLKSRRDELATRPFERAVTDLGRRIDHGEDITTSAPAVEALKPLVMAAATSPKQSTEGVLSRVFNLSRRGEPASAPADKDMLERLKALEDGQREIASMLKALLDGDVRSKAENEGSRGAERKE